MKVPITKSLVIDSLILLVVGLMTALFESRGLSNILGILGTGYAFSLIAVSLASLALHYETITMISLIQNLIIVIEGIRLGTYIIVRYKESTYQENIEAVRAKLKDVSLIKRIGIWVAMSLTTVTSYWPALIYLQQPVTPCICTYAGLVVMVCGVLLEAIGDFQKMSWKCKHPDKQCNVGLYRIISHPNYLGQATIWVGNLLTGMVAFTSWIHWAVTLLSNSLVWLELAFSGKRMDRKWEQKQAATKKE